MTLPVFCVKGEKMKFIHTADLHLDSPFQGLTEMPREIWKRVHRSTFTAFERIVNAAIQEQVGFVLIVGDIYDRDHHSAEAEDFFIRQCQRLAEANIPAFLSYGNHDYQSINAEMTNSFPVNVHVFANDVETKKLTLRDQQTVAITGFSYGQRWLEDDQLPQFPTQANADWHIGMLHGALKQGENGQDHYAPFTLPELLAKNYDYWALGHIHKHQILNSEPAVVYAGDPQGRHKNEDGRHGYYLVHDDGPKLIPEFRPVAPIEWQRITVKVKKNENISELVERIINFSEITAEFAMVDLELEAADKMPTLTLQLIQNGTLLERLQEQVPPTAHWWPYQVNLMKKEALPKLTDLDQNYWQTAAKDVFTQDAVIKLAGKLTKYDFIAEHLTAPEITNELRKQALTNLEQGDDHEN